MTGLRKSRSTKPVWSPYPPPAETNNLWCDCTRRWKDEEGGGWKKMDREPKKMESGQKMRDGIEKILKEGGDGVGL